jgi:hypothetical protein
VPDARPGLVGPGEGEADLWLAALEHLAERALENSVTVAEPVVPIHERLDAVTTREVTLRLARLGNAQVVEPQIGRERRLEVPREEPTSTGGVGPLSKSRTPPVVVLGDGEKLWKVERERSGLHVCIL